MSAYVYSNNGHPQWLSGTIERQWGKVSYLVKLNDGHTWRKHVDNIITRAVQETVTNYDNIVPLAIALSPDYIGAPNSVSEIEQTVSLHCSSHLRKPNPHHSNDEPSVLLCT